MGGKARFILRPIVLGKEQAVHRAVHCQVFVQRQLHRLTLYRIAHRHRKQFIVFLIRNGIKSMDGILQYAGFACFCIRQPHRVLHRAGAVIPIFCVVADICTTDQTGSLRQRSHQHAIIVDSGGGVHRPHVSENTARSIVADLSGTANNDAGLAARSAHCAKSIESTIHCELASVVQFRAFPIRHGTALLDIHRDGFQHTVIAYYCVFLDRQRAAYLQSFPFIQIHVYAGRNCQVAVNGHIRHDAYLKILCNITGGGHIAQLLQLRHKAHTVSHVTVLAVHAIALNRHASGYGSIDPCHQRALHRQLSQCRNF